MKNTGSSTIGAFSEFPMFVSGKRSAQEEINMFHGLIYQIRIAPELRWSPVQEGAKETLPVDAGFAVEFKEHMSRADQPVFVQRIEFRGPSVPEDIRSTDERDVVIVNNVKWLLKNLFQTRGLEERSSCLMGGKRRNPSDRTLQCMNPHVGMIFTNSRRLPIGHEVKGVLAVNHLDMMAASCQFVRELLNKDGVAAEMVGRIKRGDHAKAHKEQTILALVSRAPLHAATGVSSRCLTPTES
jgi:hypothetical protein